MKKYFHINLCPPKLNHFTSVKKKINVPFKRKYHIDANSTKLEYLGDIQIGLFQQLPDDQHVGSGAVPCDVVLGCGSFCDQRSCGVLDLLGKASNEFKKTEKKTQK